MAKGRKRRRRLVTEAELMEEFEVPEQKQVEVGSEEDARALVFMGIGDTVRALLELLDEKKWSDKVDRAGEALNALKGVLEECEAMQQTEETKEEPLEADYRGAGYDRSGN